MTIRCGNCNQKIEVPDDIVSGQHVRCPFCNVKTTFDQPSRIELPVGVNAAQTEDAKPDLHIRRPEEAATAEDPAAKRKIHMSEDRVQFYERLRTMEARRRAMRNAVSILAILGLVVAGVFAYVSIDRRRDEAMRAKIQHLQALEQQRMEQASNDRERALANEKDAQRRKARQLEDAKARAEEEQARVRLANASESQRRDMRELYRYALALFEEGQFNIFHDMPEGLEFGKRPEECYFMLPFGDSSSLTLYAASATNGESRVYRMQKDGAVQAENPTAFFAKLENRDYLVADRGKVYFHSTREKPHVGQIARGKHVVLADELFGDIAGEVKAAKLDFDDLAFEVVFIPKELDRGKKKIIITQTVEFGMDYDNAMIREAVEDAFPMKLGGAELARSKKRFKRTVRYWEGAHIKRGVDGVTYVPRTAPVSTYVHDHGHVVTVYGHGWDYDRAARNRDKVYARSEHLRAQWNELCRMADEQDVAEKLYYEEQAQKRQKAAKQHASAAEEEYRAKIDGILESGTLYWRARLKWKRR